eukprot:1187115-Prorocentrum_minimum.AAC.4
MKLSSGARSNVGGKGAEGDATGTKTDDKGAEWMLRGVHLHFGRSVFWVLRFLLCGQGGGDARKSILSGRPLVHSRPGLGVGGVDGDASGIVTGGGFTATGGGFTVTGGGFTVTGGGFTVTGGGFTVTGGGFMVTG